MLLAIHNQAVNLLLAADMFIFNSFPTFVARYQYSLSTWPACADRKVDHHYERPTLDLAFLAAEQVLQEQGSVLAGSPLWHLVALPE